MHLAIVIGGGMVLYFGNTLPMLVVLVLTKIVIDIRAHESERLGFSDAG